MFLEILTFSRSYLVFFAFNMVFEVIRIPLYEADVRLDMRPN